MSVSIQACPWLPARWNVVSSSTFAMAPSPSSSAAMWSQDKWSRPQWERLAPKPTSWLTCNLWLRPTLPLYVGILSWTISTFISLSLWCAGWLLNPTSRLTSVRKASLAFYTANSAAVPFSLTLPIASSSTTPQSTALGSIRLRFG